MSDSAGCLDDLLHVARRTLKDVEIPDVGLRESAAVLHSIARIHPLADAGRRLAPAATLALHGLNRLRLTMSSDETDELVMAVAAGTDRGPAAGGQAVWIGPAQACEVRVTSWTPRNPPLPETPCT